MLGMSTLYRDSSDNWSRDSSVVDTPLDVSEDFKEVSSLMDDLHSFALKLQIHRETLADMLLDEMAKVVHGSNQKARKGLGLDETLKICYQIFSGAEGVEFTERYDPWHRSLSDSSDTSRTQEYQAKLEKFVKKGIDASSTHVIRSRREVVQHAAAFYYIVDSYVAKNEEMSEKLIKDTHAILVEGMGSSTAGFVSNKEFGGTYRSEDVYVGAQRLPKPSTIASAMESMVRNLNEDLATAKKNQKLDPFAIAGKYCDRLVNIHPFVDGNGRMCRLIMNSILIKYAGIVVNVGEHDQTRDEYLEIARESTAVGGHAGALSNKILQETKRNLLRFRERLTRKK
jgi:prophage maintenance system killer protein